MAWITHNTIQQGPSCRPEIHVPGLRMEYHEHRVIAPQNVYNLQLEDKWMTLSTRRVDGDATGDQL
eukprot:4020954-Prorocentrum_lima.AAC.1